MALLLQGEPRRMYSWWWDSHISPRNSKWLHENLSDMDRNIKAMIKLIEEDADSFARRAEMFYKKRPELMQLMEEFYRSYRALAERYDHATGALHQAHQTIAKAFPNQIPQVMHDEPPFSSTSDIEPHTPEMPSPLRVRLDSDDLNNDAFGVSSHFTYSEENDLLSSNKRLKQSNHVKSYEGKVKEKVLNFEEVDQKVEYKEDLGNKIKCLQEEICQLSTRNDNLMSEMALESLRVLTLDAAIYKLDSMKEATLLRYKFTLENISSVGSDIANTRRELSKVSDEIVSMLTSVEEQCLAMANVNRTLQLGLETQQKELQEKRIELEEFTTSVEKEKQKRMQAEVALMSLEQIHTHSQEEADLLALEIHRNIQKLKEMELGKVGLDEKINELNEIIGDLHEQNKSLDAKIRDLRDELKLLNQTKEKLEYELGIYFEENAALQEEVFCLKGDIQDFKYRHLCIAEQMEVVLEKNVMLEILLSDANVELKGLQEKVNALEASCETLLGEVSTNVVEKGILASKIETMSLDMKRFSEKNALLENSLSDANVELEGLRPRFKHLQEYCMSLCDQNSTLLAEKSTLVSQVEDTRQSLEILDKKYSVVEHKNLNLEIEKDVALQQVLELEKSWKLEKQKHHAMETQLYVLQEEKQAKVDEFDIEQEKSMIALLDIFILQRCLCDMQDQNLILYHEFQNLLVASKHSAKQISELEHEVVIRQNESMLISEKSEKLRNGILQVLKELDIDNEWNATDSIDDEALIQTIQNSIVNTQEESQCLRLEIAVLVALLEHVGLEKNHLCHENEILTEELLSLRNKNDQAMEINGHLKAEIHNLFEKEGSLSKRFYNLTEKIDVLEEENRDVFSEALRLDHLYIFFESLSAERELELKLLRDDNCSILAANNSLDEEANLQNERGRELAEETNAKKELEKQIRTILSHISSKDREIAEVLEANRLLCRELNGLNIEVEVLRTKGEYLNSELQKKTSEVHKCEGEIRTLLNDIQISTLNAAMFEEKVLELIGACESLEILSMTRREMLGKEIASKNARVGDLKKRIDDLKGENSTLKADMNAYSSLLMSLSEGMSRVEEHILSLPKLQDKQGCSISFCLDDDTLNAPKNKESDHQLNGKDGTTSYEGFWELHKLITKVGTLQKVLTDTKKCLEQERLDSNAKLEAAKKEIEDLKLKGILPQEISKEKYGQTMKDIQLDQVSSSCASSYRENKNEKAESDDQMLGLWETSERDGIESVEEVTGDIERSMDKLEVSTGVDKSSLHECNKRVSEKLDSDAQKLLVIQKSMHKIKTKLDSLEEKKHPKSCGTFKLQLREAEKEILEQVDINVKLKKKFEDNFQSFEHVVWEKEHKQIWEKIGKLELELQKMERILCEVEEEEGDKGIGCGGRKSSILLREYLRGKRKSRFCRCMRPKTKG